MAATMGPAIPRHPTTFDKVKIAPSSRQAAPQQKTTSSTSPQDPYYGHEPTAKLCGRFVSHLFACPDYAPTTAAATPSPPLAIFIAYALHRTRLHRSVTFAALYLLQRLKQRFPAARGSSGHRLFLSAFMIASKVICDDTYSNKSWCIVGQGMFALREVNQMEREMCAYLEWELNVEPEHLRRFEQEVSHVFSGPGPYPNTPFAAAPAKSVSASQPSLNDQATITIAPESDWTPATKQPTRGYPAPHLSPRRPAAPYLATPPTTPDTPAASHSTTTSPASSAGPRTPPDGKSIEEAHAQMLATAAPMQYESAPPAALKAAAMARALESHSSYSAPAEAASKPRGKTFMMPSTRAAFAFASPAKW